MPRSLLLLFFSLFLLGVFAETNNVKIGIKKSLLDFVSLFLGPDLAGSLAPLLAPKTIPDFSLNDKIKFRSTNLKQLNHSTDTSLAITINPGIGLNILVSGYTALYDWTAEYHNVSSTNGTFINGTITSTTLVKNVDFVLMLHINSSNGLPAISVISTNFSGTIVPFNRSDVKVEVVEYINTGLELIVNNYTSKQIYTVLSGVFQVIVPMIWKQYAEQTIAGPYNVSLHFNVNLEAPVFTSDNFIFNLGVSFKINGYECTVADRYHLPEVNQSHSVVVYISKFFVDCIADELKNSDVINFVIAKSPFSPDQRLGLNISLVTPPTLDFVKGLLAKGKLEVMVSLSKLLPQPEKFLDLNLNLSTELNTTLLKNQTYMGLLINHPTPVEVSLFAPFVNERRVPPRYLQQIKSENWTALAGELSAVINSFLPPINIPFPESLLNYAPFLNLGMDSGDNYLSVTVDTAL